MTVGLKSLKEKLAAIYGVHVSLKPKKMDVPPEMKLFNLMNVSRLYDSVMARNYDGDYKGDPTVH